MLPQVRLARTYRVRGREVAGPVHPVRRTGPKEIRPGRRRTAGAGLRPGHHRWTADPGHRPWTADPGRHLPVRTAATPTGRNWAPRKTARTTGRAPTGRRTRECRPAPGTAAVPAPAD